jgi:hypothetical protein
VFGPRPKVTSRAPRKFKAKRLYNSTIVVSSKAHHLPDSSTANVVAADGIAQTTVQQWLVYNILNVNARALCDERVRQAYKDKGAKRDLTSSQISLETLLAKFNAQDSPFDMKRGYLRLLSSP